MNDNKGIAQKMLTESQLEGSLRSFLGTGHEALFARSADAEQFRRWAVSRLSGVDDLDRHLPLEVAPGVPLRYRVRDARRRSGADPYTPPVDAVAGVASLYASLAAAERRAVEAERLLDKAEASGFAALREAERQREVLAEALRDAHARLVKVATLVKHDGVDMNEIYNTAYSGRALMALEKCGLLRPQDDPSLIPAAWLPGAEEEER